MSKSNVIELSDPDLFTDSLSELLRTGARQLIEQAVEAELSEFMKQYADQVLGNGRSAIVRNGYLPERKIQTGIGLASLIEHPHHIPFFPINHHFISRPGCRFTRTPRVDQIVNILLKV